MIEAIYYFTERYPSPAEGACLESMCTGNGTVGSNPTLSAIISMG